MQDNITKILKAISDPTRRELFHALVIAATALPITQVSAQFNITRQGITKHLKTLENAGLITITTSGRERFCKAEAAPLQEVKNWVSFYEKFWDTKLDQLGDFLDQKE
ncbi:transcriptional regulator [Dokdonia pacifica]|uniref:Transcriptional regulator, ArsR family n=1 Tax=Dokdonia pacifica TaxID=1627892 RepID=A0A239DAR2_9FLAO|nr:metalloregulator ArsR/SmtB family transcription factor [Dokdonia pacifica]GGG40142.1 transcriptional regulator [Dokdonia pacifica]SNS29486.1 transcriptional regulator, ArsR family [Dokdonia pacifica]